MVGEAMEWVKDHEPSKQFVMFLSRCPASYARVHGFINGAQRVRQLSRRV